MNAQTIGETGISSDAVFMLGYFYRGCIDSDAPLWLTKRIFEDGTCAIWGGVRNTHLVGTWWEVAAVSADEANAYLETCREYFVSGMPNGFGRVRVEIVRWGEW